MSEPEVVTTAQLFAAEALERPCGQLCVDWAMSMLASGHDGDFLTRLAGMQPPFNHFEVKELRDRALREQGIADLETDALLHAVVEHFRLALAGKADLIETLSLVAKYYILKDYQRELLDFHLLHHANSNLQTEDQQCYWDGADRDNIESIVRERAAQFISDFESGDYVRLKTSRRPPFVSTHLPRPDIGWPPIIERIARAVESAGRKIFR